MTTLVGENYNSDVTEFMADKLLDKDFMVRFVK
jgi:hypothetical protein